MNESVKTSTMIKKYQMFSKFNLFSITSRIKSSVLSSTLRIASNNGIFHRYDAFFGTDKKHIKAPLPPLKTPKNPNPASAVHSKLNISQLDEDDDELYEKVYALFAN